MDAQQFLAEFGHIANSPGGVGRLRNLVLHLAVFGKLVTSISKKSQASEVIAKAQEQRDRLVQAGEARRSQPLPALSKGEAEKYPTNWVPTRLGSVIHLVSGQHLGPQEQTPFAKGIPYFTGASDFGAIHPIITRWTEERRATAFLGDILISVKGTIGKINTLNVAEAAIGRQLMAIRPLAVRPAFITLLLRNNEHIFVASSVGIAIPGISREDILHLPVGIPSLEEQSRIVAKVDELMALCDQLEAQQQERRRLQNALRQSTLQAVAAAQSPHELRINWTRLADNFGHFFSAPEDVDDVVAELKNLAVRGLLAENSASEPDIAAIRRDRGSLLAKYIEAGLTRRQKLVGIAESETPYPNNWTLCSFDEVAIVIGGVTKGRGMRGKKTITCPYLAVANVQRGHFKLDSLKTIEIAVDELPKYKVQEGDLLITEGGDWDKVGRTAIWRGGVDNCLHQNHVFKARVPSAHLLNEWVELVFNSGVGRDYFAGASKQTTNLASINMTQLRSFPLPVPPLIEQQRILDTLSTMVHQCADWRRELERKQSIATLLATAAVAALTGVTIEQHQEAAVKAPQTELIAPVRLGTPPDVKADAPLATILVRHNGELSARDLWQRFGGEIDAFYAQLKTEVAHGWIVEPEVAEMREKRDAAVSA